MSSGNCGERVVCIVCVVSRKGDGTICYNVAHRSEIIHILDKTVTGYSRSISLLATLATTPWLSPFPLPILLSSIPSLVPRPRPDFRCLQYAYRTASTGKLGEGLGMKLPLYQYLSGQLVARGHAVRSPTCFI